MKRFHVHVAVDNLAESTRFYSALFGAPPSVEKIDYAKWMLDDPRINFAISSRGNAAGINHLGFQADDASELAGIYERLQQTDSAIVAEAGTSSCYAKSDKYWVTDPSSIAWESFHTLDTIPTFNGAASATASATAEVASAVLPIVPSVPSVTTAASRCCAPAASIAAATSLASTETSTLSKGSCCG